MSATINIPVSVLKELEPNLKECIGYSWELFVHEYNSIIDTYCQQDDQKELSGEYQGYIEVPPLSEEWIPIDKWSEDAYCFSLQIGRSFPFPWDEKKSLEKLMSLCSDNGIEEDNEVVRFGLILLLSIYTKYKQMPDFGWGDYLYDTYNTDYTSIVRPDLLKLYRFINDENRGHFKITLENENKKKVVFENGGEWFAMMSRIYMNKRLCISDMKEALEELEKDYPAAKRKGRRKVKPEFDILLMGCYNLLARHSQLNTAHVMVSNQTADFILAFLDYAGILDEMSEKVNDTPYIRAKVKYLLETDSRTAWFMQPDLKHDPDEDELTEQLKKTNNYLGTVTKEKHPILVQREFMKVFNKQK